MTAVTPMTDLQRLDAAISRRAESIADRETLLRQIEASLPVSRTSLAHLRARRAILEKAAAIPKKPSQWLQGRISRHRLQTSIDAIED